MTQSIILGIDPGSQITGFCVLAKSGIRGKNIRVIDAGVIRPKSNLSHSERVGQIHESIFEVSKENQPTVCAIEKGFTGINHKSALRLGETRGAIIAAIRRHRVPVAELTPTEVKKQVTGNGHASKDDIARSLAILLGFQRGNLPFDVTDAAAIAYCYALKQDFEEQTLSRNINPKGNYPSPS